MPKAMTRNTPPAHPFEAAVVAGILRGFPPAQPDDAGAPSPDADLIRLCHRFAEKEFAGWYRYVAKDAARPDADWATLRRITVTPATTPEGWRAKALAYSAWHRDAYDDPAAERDTSTTLLAALLHDMVAPMRDAIIARLAAKHGYLPEGYTPTGVWQAGSAVA